MTRFFNRRPTVFGGMIGVLIACLVGFPMINISAFNPQALAQAIDIDAPSTVILAQKDASLSKDEKKSLVVTGVAQYEQGNRAQAKEALEKAQAVFPENYAVPYYLGLIYLQEEQRPAAIAEWQRYVAMDPQSENAM